MVAVEILVSGVFQKAFRFAGDNEFFVRRDDHEFHARVRRADDSFRGVGGGILSGIEHNAKLVEACAVGLRRR